MQISNIKSLLKRNWFQELFIHAGVLIFFSYILINRAPNFLRPLSMNARFGFTWIIPILFLAIFISIRIKGRLGHLLGLLVTLSIFGLALAGMWASGHTQSTVISGIVPLFDAGVYYVDALRLLAGRSVGEFSTARPLFPGLLAAILAVSGRNVLLALGIFTAFAGLTSYYTAREIQRTHGSFAAAFIILFIFLYYRHRTVGTIMSENLGLPLSLLAIAILWQSISQRSSNLALFGLFIFSVGLNSRPGPFFILPALIFWGSLHFKNKGQFISWRFFISGIMAVAAGFALNLVMVRLIGTSSGTPFSQFSYAFYGLASGGRSFSYIFDVHPEIKSLPAADGSLAIYRLAFDLILNNPALLIKGVFYNWSMAFSSAGYNIYSYISGENMLINTIARWSLYLLCGLGIFKWIKKPDPYSNLIVAASVGFFISIPFVPPADAYGMRLYAAGIIIPALLPMSGLVFGLENIRSGVFKDTVENHANSGFPIWSSSVLVFLLFAGPLLVRSLGSAPVSVASDCPPETDAILIQQDPGNFITIIREKDLALDWMPVFHLSLFRRNAHGLPDIYLAEWLETLPPDSTIFSTLDYQSNRTALVIVPTSLLLPHPQSVMELCGEWSDDPGLSAYGIFIATDATIHAD